MFKVGSSAAVQGPHSSLLGSFCSPLNLMKALTSEEASGIGYLCVNWGFGQLVSKDFWLLLENQYCLLHLVS